MLEFEPLYIAQMTLRTPFMGPLWPRARGTRMLRILMLLWVSMAWMRRISTLRGALGIPSWWLRRKMLLMTTSSSWSVISVRPWLWPILGIWMILQHLTNLILDELVCLV